MEAIKGCLGGSNLYPTAGLELRRVLAEKYETKVENVIAGSGSEGIMSNIIRTFLGDEDERCSPPKPLSSDSRFWRSRVA